MSSEAGMSIDSKTVRRALVRVVVGVLAAIPVGAVFGAPAGVFVAALHSRRR